MRTADEPQPAPPAAAFTADDLPANGRDYPDTEHLRARRLRLHGFAFRHVFDLLQLGREERVTRLLLDDPITRIDDAMGLVVWANKLYRERPGLGLWHARDRAGRFIGLFSLTPSGAAGDVAIGVRLLPSAWGRGYAIEGGACLCAHAFDGLRLPALIAQCAPDNRSVPPLLERLGFQEREAGTQFGNPARRFHLARSAWQGLRPRRSRRHDRGDADR
ncbi:GNAT family N-acetyltransferase [Luteimonas deserti]|uniref:GNAT family N-acetyltransferase n=1 Tax=Luteimonas deserti TaxID=2752306 RepID=A0A7Z0TXS2_9GAMM|nr:GNAT family N-acetyltransferase [Luteimonas deserti]NYZ62105.1 GNAT family N-acetyltransferase [Luteimonas deserti]